MKHILNQNFWKACIKATLLLGFMVFISSASQAQALTSIQGQTADVIPEIKIAEKMGVTYFHPGTFDFVKVQSVLTAALDALAPSVNQGSASGINKFKFYYYTLILNDMNSMSIAPELSMLDNLNPALKASPITKGEQQAVYAQTIQLF